MPAVLSLGRRLDFSTRTDFDFDFFFSPPHPLNFDFINERKKEIKNEKPLKEIKS